MKKVAMVLEDEESIRCMVGQILVDNGYHIRSYASPAETPAETPADHMDDRVPDPDVIISDVRMPHVTGLEFVRGLRSRGKPIRHIALMSGSWHPDELEEARSLGCEIFHKPFRAAALSSWLQSLAVAGD